MRVVKNKPQGEYEMLVATMLDIYGFDYACQVRFINPHLEPWYLGAFYADFVIVGTDLVIEIDGITHQNWKQRRIDQHRDAIYAFYGFEVLRVPTKLIDKDAQQALGLVVSVVDRLSERRQSA